MGGIDQEMALYSRPLDTIGEVDLQALVGVEPELKQIEHKRTLPDLKVPKAKAEFLRDVCSFANSAGGDILYGIEADKGVPTKILGMPITLEDADNEIRTLESVIREWIQPRVAVQCQPIQLSSANIVLALRVFRSDARPHQVRFEQDFRFYSRTTAGKYLLDVHELRAIYEQSANSAEKIRTFRAQRLAAIIEHDTPVPLVDLPKTVLHIVPLAAFGLNTEHNLRALVDHTDISRISPLGSGPWDATYNLEGIITTRNFEYGQTGVSSYLQVYRNGIIEVVDSEQWRYVAQAHLIDKVGFEKVIVMALPRFLEIEVMLGVEPPIAIMYSLLGVRDHKMDIGHPIAPVTIPMEGHPIDRDNLILPDVSIESFDIVPEQVMRPVFDAVWNAAGWSGSKNYDEEGIWHGR
jgi:hypothetical protein